jgi:branched-chain amino acid transport system substrate-binding protein
MLVQHVNGKDGGLKGKKIALIYHDSPYGKEPIAVLDELSKKHGYELMKLPVTHPGVEQKATWLQVRQSKPDYIFLWGWGVMNAAAIKEAIAVNYPREKMYGVWWAGAEPDVQPAEGGAKGYNALALQHSSGMGKAHQDIMKFVYDKGAGTGKKEEVGQVLYNRGMINSMLVIESIRAGQAKFGKKPLTGEQVRAGIESLNLDQAAIDKIGLSGFMQPVKVTCANHEAGITLPTGFRLMTNSCAVWWKNRRRNTPRKKISPQWNVKQRRNFLISSGRACGLTVFPSGLCRSQAARKNQ